MLDVGKLKYALRPEKGDILGVVVGAAATALEYAILRRADLNIVPATGLSWYLYNAVNRYSGGDSKDYTFDPHTGKRMEPKS